MIIKSIQEKGIDALKEKIIQNLNSNSVIYLNENSNEKTPEGKVLDNLGLSKACCRRHMLTHVDII